MKRGIILFVSLVLSACTSTPQQGTDLSNAQRDQIWQQRKLSLSTIEGWHIKGRMAVNNGSEFWAINLDWQQSEDTYVIHMSGPFGTGNVRLVGSRHGVILTDGDKNTFFAKDPDSLLFDHTGVAMPVSSMRYWVLGLPEPEQPAFTQQPVFDEQGRLDKLDRTPWQINFRRYAMVKNLQVPDKIFFNKGEDLSVRMIIADWQLTTPQVAKNP